MESEGQKDPNVQKKRKIIISDDEEDDTQPQQASSKPAVEEQKPKPALPAPAVIPTKPAQAPVTKPLEKRAPDTVTKPQSSAVAKPQPPSSTSVKKVQPNVASSSEKKVVSDKPQKLSWISIFISHNHGACWMERTYSFEVPKTKYSLVYEILKRWWYVLPEWPPKEFDYSTILKQQGLRQVPQEAFKFEPEEDASKLKKAYEMPGYPGIFIDSQATKYDCRDRTNCPSFSNLKQRETGELANMLAKALEAQVKSLATVPNYDTNLMDELKHFHAKVLKAYSKMLAPLTQQTEKHA